MDVFDVNVDVDVYGEWWMCMQPSHINDSCALLTKPNKRIAIAMSIKGNI